MTIVFVIVAVGVVVETAIKMTRATLKELSKRQSKSVHHQEKIDYSLIYFHRSHYLFLTSCLVRRFLS